MQTGDESTGSGASIPIGIEAVRVNEVLKAKYYDSAGVNWWWNTPNSHLVGKTPHQAWLSEIEPSGSSEGNLMTPRRSSNQARVETISSLPSLRMLVRRAMTSTQPLVAQSLWLEDDNWDLPDRHFLETGETWEA
jgi:hypothetical protein